MMFDVAIVVSGSTEQFAQVGWLQVGYHFISVFEFISYALDIVGFHDTQHDLAVDSKRNVDFCTFDYGGPMLVAYGVAEFDSCSDYSVGVLTGNAFEIYYQYRIEIETKYYGMVAVGVVGNDVAIDNL